jgi:hypothetical protein
VCACTDVVINAYMDLAYQLLEIVPVPLTESGPLACEAADDDRLVLQEIIIAKSIGRDGSYAVNGIEDHELNIF